MSAYYTQQVLPNQVQQSAGEVFANNHSWYSWRAAKHVQYDRYVAAGGGCRRLVSVVISLHWSIRYLKKEQLF